MSNPRYSIETNIKLVSIVGASLFVALVSTLILVQVRLGKSQAKLTEQIVPTQSELGALSGAISSLFRRQSEIIAADASELELMEDRSAHEQFIQQHRQGLNNLMGSAMLKAEPHYPLDSLASLETDTCVFLDADQQLFDTVRICRAKQGQFNDRVKSIDHDMRQLIETSSGLAGVFQLQHMSLLRTIDEQYRQGDVDLATVRKSVTGDTRVQLASMTMLDAALLRLWGLAGKVGLASSNDELTSLIANQLSQNRTEILDAIARIESLVSEEEAVQRVATLKRLATSLSNVVGDENSTMSLVTLRRCVLAEEHRVQAIQASAAIAAKKLDHHIGLIRKFAKDVAVDSGATAESTLSGSRTMTTIVSLVGLFLVCVAGVRVYYSVVELRKQNATLQQMSHELADVNANLEATVEHRTESLQMVLDSTGDGLLTVSLDGTLLPERSKAIEGWFGPVDDHAPFWDYLAPQDQALNDSLSIAFEQIAEDVFPFEVAASMMPEVFVRDGKTFELACREILHEGEFTSVLLLVNDVTSQIESAQAERHSRELHHLIAAILRDRSGFQDMVNECSNMIEQLPGGSSLSVENITVTKRMLHTIKGNAGLIGFSQFATYVHEIEDRIADEEQPAMKADDWQELRLRWEQSVATVSEYLNDTQSSPVQIEKEEFDEFLALADIQETVAEAIAIARSWKDEACSATLERLAKRATQLATRLDKNMEVTIEHNLVRMPSAALRSFWSSLSHVIRNAVDHGIETADERQASQKPKYGVLRLSTRVEDGLFIADVSDDGRGIDWSALKEKAKASGMPYSTHDDLVSCMLSDGVSTRSAVTETSGRGVGMSAVKQEVDELGGNIKVDSKPGEGTKFTFSIPLESIDSQYESRLVASC